MRLIDADAVNVKQWFASPDNRKRMAEALAAAPTIDAEPVRHGHWTEDGCCSECGEMGLYNGNEEIVRSRYCPHCGEKMDGGDHHD